MRHKLSNSRLLVSFSALLIVIMLSYTACQKQYNPVAKDSGSFIENARNWFVNDIVKKEKDMISSSYSILPSDAPARRFARMRGLNELLNWDKAMEYNLDGIHYVITPIDQDIKPFRNKNYEASRSLAFYKDQSGKMHMNIIEMLSKKGSTLGDNVLEIASIAFANKYLGKDKGIQNVNASIIFYNEAYHRESSFQMRNGLWAKANINLQNQNGAPKTRTVPLMLGRTTCGSCQTWYLVGFWYDLQTGQVVDYEILDQWDECTGGGSPPQGYGNDPAPPQPPEEDCTQKSLELVGSSVSEPAGSEIISTTATTRTRKYHWIIFKQDWGLWQFTSHETGVHEKTNNSANPWKWQSISHENISKEGIWSGGTVDCTLNTAEPYVAIYYAGMQLNYTITASALCRGFPLSGSSTYSSSMIRNVNDTN